MRLLSLAKGLLTFIPGSERVLPKRRTGGTSDAKYCYGVWMKHLTMLWQHGVRRIPDTIAELGPGDSLGIGLSAMLSGLDNYRALDVVEFANVKSNLQIFDELVEIFRNRTPCNPQGFPDFRPYLGDSLFPRDILTDDLLERSLSNERVSAIRAAIQSGIETDGISVRYMVPWSDLSVIEPGSVDLVLSHSVLEHVVDLKTTYRALHKWLKPGGVMSHQIDFSSHGLSREWNGHRAIPEILWKAMMGRRDFLINRELPSTHRALILENHFQIICDLKHQVMDGISRKRLANRWRSISDDDLQCSSIFIQAKAV